MIGSVHQEAWQEKEQKCEEPLSCERVMLQWSKGVSIAVTWDLHLTSWHTTPFFIRKTLREPFHTSSVGVNGTNNTQILF